MNKEEELEETICSILAMAEDYNSFKLSYKSFRDGVRSDMEALLEDKNEFKDKRGEIKRHDIDGTKFNVLVTKKGAIRGGDYHKSTQYDLLLKGSCELIMRKNDKDVVVTVKPYQLITIPPYTPHLFKALTDTVMLEWWDKEFEATYYKPYRRQIK